MGCGTSKSAAAEPAANANELQQQKQQPTPAATPAAVDSPAMPGSVASPSGAAGRAEDVEKAKTITKEAFEASMRKVVDLAIEGYPKALRSTLSRRNNLLRETNGNQEAAAEKIKAQAAAISEEGKTWLIGLVPYVGLPAQLLYPTWTLMRRVCLLAAVFGLDLSTEDTRARILQVFAGLRAVPATEYVMETALQMAWVAFAGPVAGFLPVGTLVTKVANVEGHLADNLGRDTFQPKGRPVPEDEYMQELDPEPKASDYLALAKEGTAFALYSAWKGGKAAVVIAQDKDKRSEATDQAVALGKQSVAVGVEVGKGAVTVGKGAVALAMDKGPGIATGIADKAKSAVGGGAKPS